MREVLFRGKRADNEEWIGGSVLQIDWCDKPSTYSIAPNTPVSVFYSVIPETVGQYTGLTDKNGTKIFEGDIIEVGDNPNYGGVAKKRIGIFIVEFYKGCFMKRKNGTSTYYHFIPSDEHNIIGNIHDNPELLQKI